MATETLTSSDQKSDSGVKRAQVILGQIAQIAHRTDRLCYYTDGAIAENSEAQELQLDRFREVVCYLGYLADIANEQLGGHFMMARGTRVENWMLPPIYPASPEVVGN
jgi:hypothetical protein